MVIKKRPAQVAQAVKLACSRTPHPGEVGVEGVEPSSLGYEPNVCMLLPLGAGLFALAERASGLVFS
jgi:hypothetical protein